MIEDINSAYELAKQITNSRNWLMIPFFISMFSVAIPSTLQLSNKITERQMRRWLVYFAIGAFTMIGIIVSIAIHDHQYWREVDTQLDLHINSLSCDQYLEFLFWTQVENPRWWYESRSEKYQAQFFDKCAEVN